MTPWEIIALGCWLFGTGVAIYAAVVGLRRPSWWEQTACFVAMGETLWITQRVWWPVLYNYIRNGWRDD